MHQNIWKSAGLLLAAALCGMIIGYPLECLLLATTGLLVWQSYQVHLLYRWLANPKTNPMIASSGKIYLIYRELVKHRKKSAQRKKRLSQLVKQFRKAIGALPDAIILIDDNNKVEWANDNANRLLGIRWPEDAGVRFGDLIRYPEVDQLLSVPDSEVKGVEINSPLDKGIVINLQCVPYTPSLRLVVARDVSHLLKVNQLHSDFVANVSHELKTPLTVLLGYLEIFQGMPELPATVKKPIEQMNLQSVRMQLLVNDLLYLAKLEDNQNIAIHNPVNMTELLDTIVKSVQPLATEKRHKLEMDIDHDLQIKGVQSELHSAFSNLITNAIHYTPDQGLIQLRWARDGDQAVFSVQDNGVGIASQHLERLTQRFYRVDNDRSREKGGTGLGLAIVKHVLQRHGAELIIHSEEHEGSNFRCVFDQSQILQPLNDQRFAQA